MADMAETAAVKIDLVPVERELLARAARAANDAVEGVLNAQQILMEGADPQRLADALMGANEATQSSYLTLLAAGATAPAGAPAPVDVPLALLDTPTSRAALDAFRFAVQAAEAMDRERGHVTSDGTPCGWTDAISDLYYRLRLQVEGPTGGGE